MKNFLKQHFWVSLIAALIISLSIYAGLSALFAPESRTPIEISPERAATVKSVEPLRNTLNVGPAPDFVVTFDVNVKADKATLKAKPEMQFEKSNLSDTKVVFRPKKSLKPNTAYVLTAGVEDLEKFSWEITTKSFQVDETFALKVNSAKKELPYKTENFKIVYDAPLDKYFADIYATPMSQYLPEVYSWFAKFGITDTSPLNITPFPANKF